MVTFMQSSASELTEQDLKRIIARRDARYDGRIFFGVRTTKIYCRVSCPARPKAENILAFKSPSEAERSGYRPCLRCRPDAAPGSEILNGTGSTVSRALRLIDDFNFESLGIERLADKLGVTDRHLRRLFDEHLGASPIEIVITKRLHMAKRLIVETNRPLNEIALAVGFQSIRRFNDAFKKLFNRTPSEFRKSDSTLFGAGDSQLKFKISIHEPYDWTTVISYLQRHEVFGIESVTSETYTRFFSGGVIKVSRPREKGVLSVELSRFELRDVRAILSRVSHLFDTRHNPAHLNSTSKIKPAGIRVPACFDGFETAISIVLSQLVSTKQATALLKKLVQSFGRVVDSDRNIYIFPTPRALSRAALEDLGLPRVRAAAIRELSRLVDDGSVDLSPSADTVSMRPRILAVKGLGPWTAELIAMRCWSDPNAFPKSDLIVCRALSSGVCREEDWSSSRAYLTHCLWRDSAPCPPNKRRTR
jgi:AraC family transcriptional regulator, regulatory protein of adaptative response / DNA-3-methyladenine glycosylase II